MVVKNQLPLPVLEFASRALANGDDWGLIVGQIKKDFGLKVHRLTLQRLLRAKKSATLAVLDGEARTATRSYGKLTPEEKYSIWEDVQAGFLTAAQIAVKHGVTDKALRTLKEQKRRGDVVLRPAGVISESAIEEDTHGNEMEKIRGTLRVKVQTILDSITAEKIEALTADRAARAAAELLKSLQSVSSGVGGGSRGLTEIVARANNLQIVLGDYGKREEITES